MYKLKLIKGLSYRGGKDGKVKVTRDKPFCVVENLEEAEALLASGHFQMVAEPKALEEKGQKEPKAVKDMTKEELITFALINGIDISLCKNNDERKAVITKALEEKGQKEPDGESGDLSDTNEIIDDGQETKIPFEEE